MKDITKWTGRVVKHLTDGEPVRQFGTAENIALLEHYYEPLTVVATEQDAGKSIRDVLEREFGVSSKLLAAARKTEYGLTINEERVYISAPVQAGEVIRLRQLREQSDDILPQPMPLDIVYEDNYLLIVNKPAGQVVHPTHGHYTHTLANGVVAYWQSKNEKFRFRPIHRLDEETSGLVAIAKNAYVHQQLSEQLQQGKVDKRYVALVYGSLQSEHDVIEGAIARNPQQPHLRMITAEGAYAKTEYWTEQRFAIRRAEAAGQGEDQSAMSKPISASSDTADAVVSLIRLKLYTGRTHQIRVHMSSIGHPLIGDKLYFQTVLQCEQLEQGIARHALHARQLAFYHPMTKQYMQWTAPLPADFQHLINRLQEGIEANYE